MGGRSLLWKVLIFTLFYSLCAAHHRYKDLYMSAFRVKKGMASLMNPIFQNSVNDVNLLYEILLDGLPFKERQFLVRDKELASLGKTHMLEVIYEDVIPKTVPEVRRVMFALAQGKGALKREDFDRTVLTLVYTANKIAQANTAYRKDVWGRVLY